MGDAQIFVGTACFNMDVAAFFTKWIQDVVDAQSAEGAFPDVAPRLVAVNDGAPAWGDAGIIVPWAIYQCYGDTRLLARHYPAMQKWIAYIHRANPGLIRRERLNNNYGDWVSIDSDTPKDVLATAYFARDVSLMTRIARVLDYDRDAAYYDRLFQKSRRHSMTRSWTRRGMSRVGPRPATCWRWSSTCCRPRRVRMPRVTWSMRSPARTDISRPASLASGTSCRRWPTTTG